MKRLGAMGRSWQAAVVERVADRLLTNYLAEPQSSDAADHCGQGRVQPTGIRCRRAVLDIT